jgi:O-antigen ligase
VKFDRGCAGAALLAGAVAAAASLGVPHEGMLQDTFKSAVVATGAFLAALVFVWPGPSGDRSRVFLWHPVLLLPLLLCAYALASMAWSQPWPAGVEAARWFVIALIAALSLQVSVEPARRMVLAWAIAGGATAASMWVLLQFVFALDLFPQGARPGSTFVNRNFFAEFAVCALPFMAYCFEQGQSWRKRLFLSVAMGLVVVAVFMTGARAALVALGGLLLVAIARTTGGLAPRRGDKLVRRGDNDGEGDNDLRGGGKEMTYRRVSGSAFFWLCAVMTVAAVGVIPSGDPEIAKEGRGETALSRSFMRVTSMTSGDEATAMRVDLWRDTAKMIADHPITGIGAGAWEHDADYHAHNELLQLVAEYGIAGWVFIIALGVWLLKNVRNVDAWQSTLLGSLLALFIVGNAGYPLHLAATGAIFALCLGSLAAPVGRNWQGSRASCVALAVVLSAALALAVYATWTASRAEGRLARAARIAIDIGGTSNPNDARWAPARSEMLRLVDEGMRLHPNERQLTPIVADELGRWGDWPNAIRIWEHVLRSHPRKVVILTNVARGYLAIGRPEIAAQYLDRARRIKPDAPSVRAVETLLRQMSSSKG